MLFWSLLAMGVLICFSFCVLKIGKREEPLFGIDVPDKHNSRWFFMHCLEVECAQIWQFVAKKNYATMPALLPGAHTTTTEKYCWRDIAVFWKNR